MYKRGDNLRIRKFFRFGVLVIAIAAAGAFLYFFAYRDSPGRDTEEAIPAIKDSEEIISVSYEDMEKEREDKERIRQEKLVEIEQSVSDYLSEKQGMYGIYFINLKTGEEFGINEAEEYIAASTSKLPINILLYKKIEAGEVDPEQILTYRKEDFEPGSGTVQSSSYGTEYSVRQASRLSIEISDNCAVNMIIRLLGIDNVRQYMLDLGGSIYYGPRHRSCPKDMALYMKELYRLYQNNPQIYGELINYLENTIYNDRINALLPEDIKVAHKIGNWEKTINDVGLIFANQTYVLSVMTKDVNETEATQSVAHISKMIFDYVQQNSY